MVVLDSYRLVKTIQAIFEIGQMDNDIPNGKVNWSTHRTIKLKGYGHS